MLIFLMKKYWHANCSTIIPSKHSTHFGLQNMKTFSTQLKKVGLFAMAVALLTFGTASQATLITSSTPTYNFAWNYSSGTAAAPYPAPMKLGSVTYTETWLWHKSGRWQLHTLTEGQN